MIQSFSLNDSIYKFTLDRQIAASPLYFTEAKQTTNSPLGRKLFGFPWTEAVKIDGNSVELTKKDWVDWDILLEPLQGLLEEHFAENTALEGAAKTDAKQLNTDGADSPEAQEVKLFLADQINPSLAMHGGFVELKSLENKIAYMQMGGGCQGCASSQMTMMEGVENALKSQFSFIEKVVDVTDHASGANPYYS